MAELLDQTLRDAVIEAVAACDSTELSLTQVIDSVFEQKRETTPRHKVRDVVLDLLYDQQLVHDAKGIVRMASDDPVEPLLCR